MLEKLAIAGTVGVGLALGLLWPTSHGSTAAPSSADVVLARSSDHHYYADANVNGHAVHFLIDTGADQIALTESDAQAAGFEVDPNKYEVIGDGASGMVRGQYVELKSIDLGGIKQRDVQAVIVQGASVSLLGQPFLEKVDQIVIRRGEMRLSPEAKS
jgi:aspartyl protease family protein